MPPEVPVRVTVGEGKHRKMTFGAGYGSEEQARARVRWDHVNFFGGARHAGLRGAVVVARSRRSRAIPRAVLLSARTCRSTSRDRHGTLTEPVYTQDTLGGRAIIRHQMNPQNFWSVSLINEYQTSTR